MFARKYTLKLVALSPDSCGFNLDSLAGCATYRVSHSKGKCFKISDVTNSVVVFGGMANYGWSTLASRSESSRYSIDNFRGSCHTMFYCSAR